MKKLTLVLSSLLISSSAIAGTGFYGELSAGQASTQLSSDVNSTFIDNITGVTDIASDSFKGPSGDSTSFGVRLGYQFNDYIAAELGYHQYGEMKETYVDEWDDTISDTIDTSATSIGLKGILPLSDQFSLFARAGYAQWDFKVLSTDSAFPEDDYSHKEDGGSAYYGLGAEFNVTESLSLGVEYSVINMDFNLNQSNELSGYGYSYSYSSDVSAENEVKNIALFVKMSF